MKSIVAVTVVSSIWVVACGGSPRSVTSPSAVPTQAYAANLTLTGGLSGTVTRAKAVQGVGAPSCGGGKVQVAISLDGGDWSVGAAADPYHGPGEYKPSDGFVLILISPSSDIWMSAAGTAVYKNDKALSVDADVTNLMTPSGAVAHISGSFSCR